MVKFKYRAIKSRRQYFDYCNKLEALIFSHSSVTSSKEEITALTVLIEKWDLEHNSFIELNSIKLLQSFIKDHKLRLHDLGKILHLPIEEVQQILNYKKGLSLESICKLAAYFKVSYDAFSKNYKLRP